jgi:type II secretory pathway component PulF
MSIINVKQNNSFQSMNIDHRLFVKSLINIFTLLSVSFAIIISLFIIVYVFIIYNLRNHSQNSFNVSLLLTCNTCFLSFLSSKTAKKRKYMKTRNFYDTLYLI